MIQSLTVYWIHGSSYLKVKYSVVIGFLKDKLRGYLTL